MVEDLLDQQPADGGWDCTTPGTAGGPRTRSTPGRQWFELEPPGPNRWNAVRAMRVLTWWDR